jgi:hypothetical protein
VFNHSQHTFRQRTTQADLDGIEDWTDRAARRMYQGAGLGPKDVDIFTPYDGYAPMAQFFLEGFQWHGVKRGDAFAFLRARYQRREPAPVLLERRQSGDRACRTAIYTDSIEQLGGTAGRSGFGRRRRWRHLPTPSSGGWIMLSANP